MRECFGENVRVFEVYANTASALHKKLANELPALEEEATYVNVYQYLNQDDGQYYATVYVH